MPDDIYHIWSQDIAPSPTGGLRVSGGQRGLQRLLRRLMTCAKDVMENPLYGGGLPEFVGAPTRLRVVKGRIMAQCAQEVAIQQDPAPTITVTPIPDGIFCFIQFVNAETGETDTMGFNVS